MRKHLIIIWQEEPSKTVKTPKLETLEEEVDLDEEVKTKATDKNVAQYVKAFDRMVS